MDPTKEAGGMANIVDGAIAELQKSVGGTVAEPGQTGYDDAVNIWNAACSRRPAVVVSCTSTEDVAAALAFAQEQGLEVSVRGGGHNYAGFALCDDGLMIDLTPMKTVTVDPEARTARCGGGTTWGEFDAATQAHGLATPGGFISRTGVAGLTLGGGFGWLTRLAGLSADNLIGAEVVTADGRFLHASDDRQPRPPLGPAGRRRELRGGDRVRVRPPPCRAHAAARALPVQPRSGPGTVPVRSGLRRDPSERVRGVHGRVERTPGAIRARQSSTSPRSYGLVVVGFGDEEQHARLIAPIKKALTPVVELVTPIPYVGLQQMFDGSAPWGMHSYEKAVYLTELTDGAIETILEHQARKVSPLSFVPIFVLGGAYRTADGDASAFGGSREFRYVINVSATAMSPDDYDSERSWSRVYWSALVEHAVGCRKLRELHDRVRGGPRP